MNKNASYTLNMSRKMKENLKEASNKHGLNQSDIIRRGILEQLKELNQLQETDENQSRGG